MTKQTHAFQAEVKQILHLVTHSLYSNKEIFLRELVSNASDACDKLRFEALDHAELYEDQPTLEVRVSFDAEAKTLTIRDTDGTDHLAFDAVGLPGFQFIQDDLEYDTRTHHSNMDVYERLVPQDMMQNAVIVAAFAAQTANRDALLPRKPTRN